MVKKYPSELKTKTIRINLEDSEYLSDLARQVNMSLADFIHFVIVSKLRKNGNTE